MKDNEIEALFIVESRIFEVIKKFDENYDRWQKSDPEGDDDNGYEVCAHMSDVYAARVGHAVMRDIREAHYHKNKYHAEAKEEKGMNIAVDSKVKGRMPECEEMELVVVDAPNLTPEQISELAQPISPDTSTQSSTLKAILQQLILINERLEKWEQAYVAHQEIQRIWSMPVYKKKEGK